MIDKRYLGEALDYTGFRLYSPLFFLGSDRSRQRCLAEVRGVIAWLVVQNQGGTLTELAQRYHRDLSAMSLAVREIDEKRNKGDEKDACEVK